MAESIEFVCPHCHEMMTPVAQIDQFYTASGTAELCMDADDMFTIDWDTLDADIPFFYTCGICDEILAHDLTTLTEMYRAQQSVE